MCQGITPAPRSILNRPRPLKFETRNLNSEKTSHGHNGEPRPCFNCIGLDLVEGKTENSFNVFFSIHTNFEINHADVAD